MCAGQFGVFVYLVLRCLLGCCTWFSCCFANVRLSICVWYCHVPGNWLSYGPWQESGPIWAFIIIIKVFKNIFKNHGPFHSLWSTAGLSGSPCGITKDTQDKMTAYATAAMHSRLLLNQNVHVLNCIHCQKAFAGAELYNSSSSVIINWSTHTHTHTRLTALCPGLPR